MKEKAVTTPLYTRGINRAKAEKVAQMFMHKYQPPITCVHVWGKTYRAPGKDRNVMLQDCKLCTMVIGWVT